MRPRSSSRLAVGLLLAALSVLPAARGEAQASSTGDRCAEPLPTSFDTPSLRGPFSSPCANPCTCTGDPASLRTKVVSATAVLACIRDGKAVELSQVSIVGDLDLSAVLSTALPADTRLLLPGVRGPREGLDLDSLERRVGRVVTRGRIVAERVSIEKSSVFGRVLGPTPPRRAAQTYAPLVFAQPVNLGGTTIYGDTSLAHARFLMPLRAEATVFRGKVELDGATFAAAAAFRSSMFAQPVSFDRAEFKDLAAFDGVAACNGIRFVRTVFGNGLWLHAADAGPAVLVHADFRDATIKGREALFDDLDARGLFLFHHAEVHADARFARAVFAGPAQFDDTSFIGAAAFNRTRFLEASSFAHVAFKSRRPASFDDTYFWDVTFDGAEFAGNTDFARTLMVTGSFRDVDFGGAVDYRRAIAGSLQFGGRGSKTAFRGPVSFDDSRVGAASFQNAVFESRAVFTGATFGEARRVVAIDLGGALFRDALVFDQATFRGLVNLSNSRFEAARLSARWDQLAGRIVSGAFTMEIGGDGDAAFTPDRAVASAAPRSEVLRSLEMAFTSQNRLEDANAAYRAKEDEELTAIIDDATRPLWERAGTWVWRAVVGGIGGYGVSPWRILGELGGVWAICALAYAASRRQLAMREAAPVVTVRPLVIPAELPSVTRPMAWPRRIAIASWLSLAALTGIAVHEVHAKVDRGDWVRTMLGAERAAGAILLAVLLLALTNTMPALVKLLGWLIPS